MQVTSSSKTVSSLLSQVGAACGLLVVLVTASLAGSATAEPALGEPAPAFAFEGTDGALHLLSEHKGKRGVVLAWFPKAFTPG